jgi:hypothetical protein
MTEPRPAPKLGDDVAEVPDPVTEVPPTDRFCDLVLTGGVASGVVYPWAIVELARQYRFKSIGGTSVGAMAAALAAAAEYGRRCGFPYAFEPLRLLPGKLAEETSREKTRLLALFQPAPRGERLFRLFVDAIDVLAAEERVKPGPVLKWLGKFAWAFRSAALAGALLATVVAGVLIGLPGAELTWLLALNQLPHGWSWLVVLLPIALVGAALGLLWGLAGDVRHGLIENDLGLVRGGAIAGRADDDPALVAWLHEGIQASAGLKKSHPPLTFGDLWCAPAYPGEPPPNNPAQPTRRERSINLEMITTNVTHGRPYRLPMEDETSRLFFKADEWALFFPPAVMQALLRDAKPYRPRELRDPPADRPDPARPGHLASDGLLELPTAEMPIVVAARLSLSFPLLFSALPLYAIDYEAPMKCRAFTRCRFSDGGICSNFPIHMFDSAMPSHPTFGMWLGKRSPYHAKESVWLPKHHLDGRGDSWRRFETDDPAAARFGADPPPGPWQRLFGFLLGAAVSAKDWSDRSAMRMPQARNRVARINLRLGEGELNIAMPRETILKMAQEYGTRAGRTFVARFATELGQPPRPAWTEHQWVRLHTLLGGLREFLGGLADVSRRSGHTVPLRELIEQDALPRAAPPGGNTRAPVAPSPAPRAMRGKDSYGEGVSADQAEALRTMLQAAEGLEAALRRNDADLPYRPMPTPEMRLRPPI